MDRVCSWCGGPIPDGSRSDRTYCSHRCQQAACRRRAGGREYGEGWTQPGENGTAGAIAPRRKPMV